MTTNTTSQTTESISPPTDEQIISQLATLQSLHDKIFQLRSLLPERLIDPVKAAVEASGSGHEPPAALAAHLRSVAVDGDKDVKEFKERWRCEAMKGVWAKAKVESFPQGSDVWAVDYREMMRVDEASSSDAAESENVDEVLEKFGIENPKVKIERQVLDTGKFVLDVTVAGQNLLVSMSEDLGKVPAGGWLVAPKSSNQATTTYKVEDMVRSLQDRSNRRSLKYLLDMVASYTDMGTRPCEKCHNIYNNDTQLPAVRILKPQSEDGNHQFLAYHRGCL